MAIIGLVVVLVGLVSGWIPNPFAKGNVDVSLGYILADGTKVPLETGKMCQFYTDPTTLKLYKTPDKDVEVLGVYGELVVNPATDIGDTVSIDWEREVWAKVLTWSHQSQFDASDTTSVAANQDTTILDSRCEITESNFLFGMNVSGNWTLRFDYHVMASVGDKWDVEDASGQINVYYSAPTLSLTASTSTGYLEIA